PVSERERNIILASFDRIAIWDQNDLLDKAKVDGDLLLRLSELIRETQLEVRSDGDLVSRFLEELSKDGGSSPPPQLGSALALKLESSSAGRSRKAAQQFEQLCEEALSLLFDRDLSGWKRQALIERGFHRMDLIARLVPRNAFWVMLVTDFRCRYVTFEFKNYNGAVTQSEIFTTEKYLFIAALRSVAIIIARNGANQNAERAMNGALREQGKLILCLSLSEICGMLRGFDVGEDPCNVLSQKLDEMLISIGR
ncbi:MAG TPA: hypothetical protein VFX22_12030, partial [Candidatus Kapabacteria bacterium]|nr:hypothetical protein [Candidatus Kapabacteria bacterium]